FRPARCCSTGSGRLDLDLLISGPRDLLFYQPHACARALLARPWSARCYGVARQRDGSRQNSLGGSGVLSLRHFGLVLYPLILGAWVPKNLPRRGWFRPGRCCSTGSGRLDLNLDLLISGPRDLLFYQPHACARALLARPWSARCYGVARQREGSRQNSITRRLLTNRPCSTLVYEESDSKERLRARNG